MRIVLYLSLYQTLFQVRFVIVWSGLANNAILPLMAQQKQIVRICLSKCTLEGVSSNRI